MVFDSSPPPAEPSPSSGGPESPWNTPPHPLGGTQFSHGGLTRVDPWTQRHPWYHAIWPWGLSGVVETLDVMILALAMFLCVRFVAHNYIVDGASMVPTFEDSDFLIVNRLAYRSFDFSWIPGVDQDDWRPFGEPEPGDVVVFAYQQEPSERDFIKRVIAVPGQTVEVHDGQVFVDGVALVEPYIAQAPDYELPPTAVEPGMVFVLGDNRNNSFDSHAFGPVDASTIVGRAEFRYWPVGRWGFIDHVVGSGADAARRLGDGVVSLWR